MLVTDRRATAGRALVDTVLAAVAGGVRMVQLREKDLPDGPFLALACDLLDRLPGGVVLLLNGRPALAARLGTGLHLPEGAALPRRLPRPWGRAVHSAAAAAAEVSRPRFSRPDYLVAGTVFPTSSKPSAAAVGTGGLRRIVGAADGLPVFAIGGMGPGRVREAVAAGAHGVAVRSAVLAAPDPAEAAARLLEEIAEVAPAE